MIYPGNLVHNTRDGLHIASLAGSWIAAVAGFGGMRHHGEALSFTPRPPPALGRLAFRLSFQRRRLLVEVRPAEASYMLLEGEPLAISHHGERLTVSRQHIEIRAIPRPPELQAPTQPAGRAPARRRARREPGGDGAAGRR